MNSPRFAMIHFWAPFLLWNLIGTPGLHAQQPPGKDCYCFPPGGKRGTTVEVTLGGTDWTPDVQFLVHDPRLKLEILSKPGPVLLHEPPYWFDIKSFSNDPWLPREVSARITIPADMPPSRVLWSIANANGAHPGGVFVVNENDSIRENEDRVTPQEIPSLPISIEGRLKRIEEVDQYTFKAPQSGIVTCKPLARGLGNELNLVVSIQDESGAMIAESHDTLGADPTFTFSVIKDRRYLVSVRDIDHRGYRSFTYQLDLAMSPRLVFARPMGAKPGEKRQIEFFGTGIVTGKNQWESTRQEVTFPTEKSISAFPFRLATATGLTNEIRLSLNQDPEQLEPLETKNQPVPMAIPGAMNGLISKTGETDRYSFQGKKGDTWVFELQARSLGSPVEPFLELKGPDSKSLIKKDGAAGSPDPRFSFALTADGIHTLTVGDLSGKPVDGSFFYRLVGVKPVPDFSVHSPGILLLPMGSKTDLTIQAKREGGFTGPITIQLKGLPNGVVLPKEAKDFTIPANADSVKISLDCPKDAAATASLVDVAGTATINGKTISKEAQFDTPMPQRKLIAAMTMKAPFKVKAAEADGGRRIPRGTTHQAEILIERDKGFEGEIILDMAGNQQRHRQGIRGDAVTVLPKQNKIIYPVFIPEWLETTRTSRIGLVAMAKIPDPKGNIRHVMAPMEGQITMSIEGALLKLGVVKSSQPHQDQVGIPGKPVEIPLRIVRVPQMTGPVTIEWVPDPRLLGLVSAEPLQLNEKTIAANLKLQSKADSRLLGVWKLKARATGKHNGHPVVSETTFEMEWTKEP